MVSGPSLEPGPALSAECALPFDLKSLEQILDKLLPLLGLHGREVLHLPPNGWKLFHVRNAEEFPLRLAPLEGSEELVVFSRHLADEFSNQVFAGLQQLFQRDRIFRHPGEAALEFLRDV